MTLWLRVLAAFLKDPGLSPSTHIAAQNHLQVQEMQHSLLTSAGSRHKHGKQINMPVNTLYIFFFFN